MFSEALPQGAIARPLTPRGGAAAAPLPAPEDRAEPQPGFAFTLLPRHGRRPLGFHGRLLVSAAVEEPGLPVASTIALHETEDGGLVAAIRHATRAPLAEAARCYAAAAAPDALLGFLHAHDPLRDLPADWLLQAAGGDAEAERLAAAAALAPRLRAAWRGLIAACFGHPEAGIPPECCEDPAPPHHHTHHHEPGDMR
jgi:hypothetical protein